MKNKAFTLIELLVVITIVAIFAALIYNSYCTYTDPKYVPYLMPQERMANELKRANDLKELELQILRGKLPAEKN